MGSRWPDGGVPLTNTTSERVTVLGAVLAASVVILLSCATVALANHFHTACGSLHCYDHGLADGEAGSNNNFVRDYINCNGCSGFLYTTRYNSGNRLSDTNCNCSQVDRAITTGTNECHESVQIAATDLSSHRHYHELYCS